MHHDQLTTDLRRARRRIVEFHRNRDRYLRKHHSSPERYTVRALGVWFYLVLRRSPPWPCPATTRGATCCTPARS